MRPQGLSPGNSVGSHGNVKEAVGLRTPFFAFLFACLERPAGVQQLAGSGIFTLKPFGTSGSAAITVAIHPQFSDFDLQSLAMGALPLAFAAAAQTVVVISGGIDLSIGSVMAVTNGNRVDDGRDAGRLQPEKDGRRTTCAAIH
jgi:hypothetical protein